MRVISGEFKGRRISPVSGNSTRPTTDRVKEAWASTLAALLPDGFTGIQVLDAFAGSGALGIEALSRGASRCCFCESDNRAYAVLKRNTAFIREMSANIVLLKADLRAKATHQAILASLLPNQGINLIILDPPYDMPKSTIQALLASLQELRALADDVIISYEHRKSDDRVLLDYNRICNKSYGTISIDYYSRRVQ